MIEDLRDFYVATTHERLGEMLSLLDTCARDAVALASLARHFHALSGMGTTYGFPRISELGEAAETAILPLVRGGGFPDDDTVRGWRTLVENIRVILPPPCGTPDAS